MKSNLLVINKSKKILVVTAAYPPAGRGQATDAKLLKDELPKYSQDKVRAIILNTGRFCRWPGWLRFLAILVRTLYLGRYCEVIYTLDLFAGRPASVAARLLRKPFWFKLTAEAVWASRRLPEVKRRLVQLVKSGNLIIAPNKELRTLATDWGGNGEKTVILPNVFTPPANLETHEMIRVKWKVSGKIVVAVGPLTARKNLSGLLSIWPAVLERFPEAKLLILGDGPERSKLEEIINRLGIADSVMLTGLIPSDTLYIYLRLADVAVWISRFEAGSHGVIEARALGTPIVATAVGDNQLLLAGYPNVELVSPAEPAELVSGLNKILSQPAKAVSLRSESGVTEMITAFLRLLIAVK